MGSLNVLKSFENGVIVLVGFGIRDVVGEVAYIWVVFGEVLRSLWWKERLSAV